MKNRKYKTLEGFKKGIKKLEKLGYSYFEKWSTSEESFSMPILKKESDFLICNTEKLSINKYTGGY